MKKERKSPAIVRFVMLPHTSYKTDGLPFSAYQGFEFPIEVTIRKVKIKNGTKI